MANKATHESVRFESNEGLQGIQLSAFTGRIREFTRRADGVEEFSRWYRPAFDVSSVAWGAIA